MDSVLLTIKKLLGIDSDYTHFDKDIIIHINSVLMALNQIGVGPDEPVTISSEMDTWSNILGDTKNLEAIKRALDWEKTHTVLVSKVILMDDNYKDVKCILDKKMQ